MLKRLHNIFAFLTVILIAIFLAGCTVSQAAERTPAPIVTWTAILLVQAVSPVPIATVSSVEDTAPTASPTDIPTIIVPSATLTDTDSATALPATITPIPTNTRRP